MHLEMVKNCDRVMEPNELGAAIRNRRKKFGYTRAEIAEFLGYSEMFISDLENGHACAIECTSFKEIFNICS